MSRAATVVLGDVNEAPMPVASADEVRETLSRSDCRGVVRRGDLLVKVTARALAASEAASKTVAPLTCAGALLGTVSQAGDTWLVEVCEALPLNVTPEVHRVRVTRHAWQEMLAVRAARHSHLRVVGWVHSHPGVGVSFSDADAFVQRYFFPADWQVACVIDPDRRDVQFFSRRGRHMSPLGAFWVERGTGGEGEVPGPRSVSSSTRAAAASRASEGGAQMPPQPEDFEGQQTTDTYLKERFVERSLEKILKMLKEPPLTARDFVMMALMGLMLVVLIFTRTGSSSTISELKEITARLDAISQRLEAMPADSAPGPVRKPTPHPVPSSGASGDASVKAPLDNGPDVEYSVKEGESLWSISLKFYEDGSLQTPLMRYNKIRDARDIKAGAIIKVPALAKLKAARAGKGNIDVPPPTPH